MIPRTSCVLPGGIIIGKVAGKWVKLGEILRDGIASGRGVHRFWGSPIQKSRSKLGVKSQKSRKFGTLGVGVV